MISDLLLLWEYLYAAWQWTTPAGFWSVPVVLVIGLTATCLWAIWEWVDDVKSGDRSDYWMGIGFVLGAATVVFVGVLVWPLLVLAGIFFGFFFGLRMMRRGQKTFRKVAKMAHKHS
jgi:hypothetical protein